MGLFASLFGSSGSDKADKLRQQALDAFGAIQTPELKDLQVQLDKYVQAGQLTPEQAEAQLLNSNAYNDIVSDPSLEGAQKQALASLQAVANQGGLTAVDKAQLQDITNQQNQEARGRNEAVMSAARERGTGGSDLNTVNQLMNEQSAADQAAQRGTDVAAQAQQRALAAMQAAGTTAGNIRTQDYGEAANKAAAQNAIDLFNKQTLNQTNLYNTQTANAAQAANLANAQSVANANTETGNANKTYNAQQVQQQYNDALQKAQGEAGIYSNWANDATNQAKNEKAADMGLTSGLLQAGGTALATAFGGPAGAVASQGVNPTNKKMDDEYSSGLYAYDGGRVPGYSEGGEVDSNKNKGMSPDDAEPENKHSHECYDEFCLHPEADIAIKAPLNQNKGLSRPEAEPENKYDFERGGKVPGKPIVPHNSIKNDVVDAHVTPGEVIVPLDAQKDDAEFEAFMNKFKPSVVRQKKIDTGVPLEKQALANLHTRVKNLEGGK